MHGLESTGRKMLGHYQAENDDDYSDDKGESRRPDSI